MHPNNVNHHAALAGALHDRRARPDRQRRALRRAGRGRRLRRASVLARLSERVVSETNHGLTIRVIRRRSSGRRDRRGLHRPGPRRGVAADRGRGRRPSGIFARASTISAAERLAIPRVYRDLDELLDDERVGVVHVASPNAHHFDQARRVLESGRHVICEKPLATSSRETAALRALAESRPSQAAAVNYNIRYYPLCHEIRERIAGGSLGRVLSVTGSYVQDWLLYPEDYNWRVEPDGRTNLRAVADIGTHWMDLAQFLIGRRSVPSTPIWPRSTRAGSSPRADRIPSAARADRRGSARDAGGRDHDRRPRRGAPAVRWRRARVRFTSPRSPPAARTA